MNQFDISVSFGGERLYVEPFIPSYYPGYPSRSDKIPVFSQDGLPNCVTCGRIGNVRISDRYNMNYSLPFQLCVKKHDWVDLDYLPPTKEFIYMVLSANANGELLGRYENDNEVDGELNIKFWKIQQAKNMIEWIEKNGGIEAIEFIYSLDT